jgi:hypothetical protein
MSLHAGDWVEIRSKAEILETLNEDGNLDGLPFMPQMFEYCGQRFQVYRRAHKTCDTVNSSGGRRLNGGIHLEGLRCDGQAYGGCQAACLLFWKEAWLKPLDSSGQKIDTKSVSPDQSEHSPSRARCTEDVVAARVFAKKQSNISDPVYTCQATELPKFTEPLPWWDARQYVEDYTSGNVPINRLIRGFVYATYYIFGGPGRNPIRKPFQWLYDRFVGLWGGVPFPRRGGIIPVGQPQPDTDLNLQPGDLIRVKSYPEILATIDQRNKNKGLFFDAEMVPFCGKTYRVRTRVSRFINEQTGKLIRLKTPAVILESVWCRSHYSDRRMHCPRSIYSWWREVWLERVPEGAAGQRLNLSKTSATTTRKVGEHVPVGEDA